MSYTPTSPSTIAVRSSSWRLTTVASAWSIAGYSFSPAARSRVTSRDTVML